MSKKQQTTGGPSSKHRVSKYEDDLKAREKHIAREQQIQKWAIGITVGIIALIAIILLIIFVVQTLVLPNQTVATVNGENITAGEFQAQVAFEQERLVQQVNGTVAQIQALGMDPNQFFQSPPYSTWINELNFPDQLGKRVLNDMINDKLIAQKADELGIKVNDEAVENEINTFFGYDPTEVALIGTEPTATTEPTLAPTALVSPTPSATPMPTATPDIEVTEEATEEAFPTFAPSPTASQEEVISDYEANVKTYTESLTAAGVPKSQIDAYFQRRALRKAVMNEVVDDITTATYVNARHILVATEEEAQEVVAALESGELFSDLAAAISLDQGSAAQGGELDWTTSSSFVEPFRDAVNSGEIGALLEPVKSDFGYHIIQVRAREEREVSDNEAESLKAQAFEKWLSDELANEENEIVINDIWVNYLP